jgi:hypothetical protein
MPAKMLRWPELKSDRSGPGVVNQRCELREAKPGELVLSTEGHVRGNEAMLYRIHKASHRLDVGSDIRRHKEAELRASRHVRDGAGGCDLASLRSCTLAHVMADTRDRVFSCSSHAIRHHLW